MGSSGNHFCVQWNNHQKNLLGVVSELLQTNALTDVTLGVEDGRSVECHKMILAACSSYFQSLFISYPYKHPFVVLSGISYPEILRIVEFMYKGEVSVDQDELDAILKVAQALQVKGLTEANEWSPNAEVSPSPVDDTTNDKPQPTQNSKNSRNRRKSSSPTHSSRKTNRVHEESSASCENQSIPSWPLSQGLPLGPEDLAAADAAYQLSSFSNQYPLNHENHCEKNRVTPGHRTRKRKMPRENVINRGTPISRTAMKQNHPVDPPQLASPIYPEHQQMHYNSPANGSTNVINEERDDGRNSVDFSYRCPDHGPQINDHSIINNVAKTSFSEESKAGIKTSHNSSNQSHEGKRYKKYTRDDLSDAIQAVKEGMSANKAALLFKVPSRTLYDKIKKLGFTNQKHRRSGGSSSSSSACFPYGIGGNVDGRIYGHMMENENENSNLSMETSNNQLESSHRKNRNNSSGRKNAMKETDRKPRLPLNCPRSQSPLPIKSQPEESTTADDENGNDNEAQDLSVSRKSEIAFQIPPNIVIKEENIQEDQSSDYSDGECNV